MKIGYICVSTLDQTLNLQEDVLRSVGCKKVFIDRVSGSTEDRPSLSKAKGLLQAGDTLVVWRLDRLGRSLQDLIRLAFWLNDNDITFQSLCERIDTSTSAGKITLRLFKDLAEFERNITLERAQAKPRVGRARGRIGGRPKALNDDGRRLAVNLYNEGKKPVGEICSMMGICERPPAKSRWLPVTAKSRIGPPFGGLGARNKLGLLTPPCRKIRRNKRSITKKLSS